MTLKGKKRKVYAKSHYLRNKTRYQERDKKRIEKGRQFVRRYKRLRGIKCCRCNEHRWQCLDFHHKNPDEKYKSISFMIHNRASIKKLKEEIRKCEIICANCHRVEHNGCVWDKDSSL